MYAALQTQLEALSKAAKKLPAPSGGTESKPQETTPKRTPGRYPSLSRGLVRRSQGSTRHGLTPKSGAVQKGNQLVRFSFKPPGKSRASGTQLVVTGRHDEKPVLSKEDEAPGNQIGIARTYAGIEKIPDQTFSRDSFQFGNVHGERVRGSEFLTTVHQVGTSAQVMLAALICNPCLWLGTRIAIIAQTFLRWRAIQITVEFVPSVPSTAGGSLSLAIAPDSTQDFTSVGDTLSRQIFSLDHNVQFSTFEHAAVEMTWNQGSDWLYLQSDDDGDDRFENCAVIAMAMLNATTLAANSVLGTLMIHYDLEFAAEMVIPSAMTTMENLTFSHAYMARDTFGILNTDFVSAPASQEYGQIYALIVTGLGGVTWTFYDPNSSAANGGTITVSVGSLLFMRNNGAAANVWYIAASLPAAGNENVLRWQNNPAVIAATFRAYRVG